MAKILTRSFVVLALSAMFSLVAASARADAVLDFSGQLGGVVDYAGHGGPLFGSGLAISQLEGGDTPLNDGSILNFHGILDFVTGNFLSYSNSPTKSYSFSPGGTFQIHGNIPSIGLNCAGAGVGVCAGANANGALLLSGTFTDVVTLTNTATSGVTNSVLLGLGSDVKNSAITDYFGMAADTLWAFTVHMTDRGGVGSGGAFDTKGASNDILNDQVIPEPASLFLLGSGLTLLGTAIRRRRKLGLVE